MRERDYSFIDLFITFIFLFYFEYKICLDLFEIYSIKEIELIYFFITIIFFLSVILFTLYFNKLEHYDIKTYSLGYFVSFAFCILHVLLLLYFISILSFRLILIIQCVLPFGLVLLINNKSDFSLRNCLLFLIAYIAFIILVSSIVVYCNV
jgi:hypothetical protein